MGLPRWELVGRRETGRGIYHRRWDIQDGNWQVGRREEEFTTGDGTSKVGTGRYGDGKRNLPDKMGHPRWELAGRETGRGIYHRRWDIQDGNWQVGRREEEFTRWELAGRETGRGIYHRRWDIQDRNWQVGRETGRGIYQRRWDIQDGNWQVGRQVGRREEEFTT